MNSDLISREALKKKLQARHVNGNEDFGMGYNVGIETAIALIVNAPTVEQPIDEWCTDCKEYDHEKNCCPRFNKVIRETLKDAQPTNEKIIDRTYRDDPYEYMSQEPCDYCPYRNTDKNERPTGEWIPVSERLPDVAKRYLVYTKYDEIMTDFFMGDMFLQGNDIIAWMPLPEPYKKGGEGE